MDKQLLLLGVCILMITIPFTSSSGASFTGATWNGTWISNWTGGAVGAINDSTKSMMLEQNIWAFASFTNDRIQIANMSNPMNPISLQNFTDSAGGGSIDGVYSFDMIGDIVVVASSVDSNLQVFIYNFTTHNITNRTFVVDTAGNGSIEGAYSVVLENRSGSILAHVGGRTDDSYSIFNITTTAAPVFVGNWTYTDNPCSMDNVYMLAVDPIRYLTYAAANADNVVSIVNTSNPRAITCVKNWSKTTSPFSTEGTMNVMLLPEYNYTILLVAGSTDNDFSIWNVSDPSNPVNISNYNDNVPPCSISMIRGFGVTDGGRTAYIPTRGQLDHYGMSVLNITNLSSPTCIGWINDTTDPGYSMNGTYWVSFDNRSTVKYTYITGVNSDLVSIINESILYPAVKEPGGDTCSCPVATDWRINLANLCNITSNCDITGYRLILENGTSGDYCNVSATITARNISFNLATSGTRLIGTSTGYVKYG